MRGGARTRSGPAPDPRALRRERKTDSAGWITLPAEGREGEPPVWPLITPSERELELWADLWSTPQAAQWEHLGNDFEVAFYVRNLARAEVPDSVVALSILVRQFGDSLGLSTAGMLRNRWRIGLAADLVAERVVVEPPRISSRERLRVTQSPGAEVNPRRTPGEHKSQIRK